MEAQSLKSAIVEKALDLGFLDCRFAKAERLDEESHQLRKWLNNGFHGEMSYMENHFDKRVDPTKLVPGAKTVICLSYNYYTSETQEDPDAPKISMYAYGRDYHKVVRKKLKALLNFIQDKVPDTTGRGLVDSAPILERDWAKRSGLGWVGKNTLVIHPKKGSYFFLAEIIVDAEIPADEAIGDYCGTCTKCIDACPTQAIDKNGYLMDGSKCISYLTIELKEEIPDNFKGKMENWMYGCDICQQVCPWNRFSKEHDEKDFLPSPELMSMTKNDWQDLTEERFNTLFFGSAVKRTKYEGLKRNIRFLKDSD